MTPILYEANETEYISNGLGRLSDAISCIIRQTLNGEYELEMSYPYDGIHADELTNNRIIYARPEKGATPQPFRIRDIDKTLTDQIKVIARHRAYDLSFYACMEFGQTEYVPYEPTPVLYDSNKSTVIGALSDAVSWQVIKGSKYTFTMLYPVTGAHYSQIRRGRYIYAQPGAGLENVMFEILSIDSGSRMYVTATADISAPVDHEYNSMTVGEAVARIGNAANIIQSCPFNFSTAPAEEGDAWATELKGFWSEKPTSARALMGTDSGALLDVYGGEWMYDNFDCILYEKRGSNNGIEYRYGKNISNISERINIDELFTHAFSFWKGTESSSTNTELGQYFVAHGNVIKALESKYNAMFPTQRTLVIDASSEFKEQPTTAELDEYTRQYIKNNSVGVPTVTINVDIADLSASEEYADIVALETVSLGDTVKVVFPRYGIDIDARVTEINFDVLLEKNNAVTIGETTVNLSDIIASNKHDIVSTKYDLQKWADRMTERAIEALSGWYGGNVRKNFSVSDHKQQSMFIMDSDNVDTAQNAIKFDAFGMAISGDGANGNYVPFVDMRGKSFSDQFAETGDTNGSFLKRGKIQPVVSAEDGKPSFIDMETAEADLYGNFRGVFDGDEVTTSGDVDVGGRLLIKGQNVMDSIGRLDDPTTGLNSVWSAIRSLDERVKNLGG